jgi:RNA polymerase sigma-70 factor (ECF subfamily)
MSSASLVFGPEYVEALRRGDPAVESHFVEHFSPMLSRTLRRKLRSSEQMKDVRQETFLRVFSALRAGYSVRNPERFDVFVMGVCNNILRETYREQRRSVALTTLEEEPVADFPSAYALMVAQETGLKVRRVLSRLHAEEQGILQAVLMDEQNKDEICDRFGVSRSYLRVLLYRAKKRFRNRAGKDVPSAGRRNPKQRLLGNIAGHGDIALLLGPAAKLQSGRRGIVSLSNAPAA